jgi:predicted RNA-binding Zn-ribbon protein involved in translation (DUF1610 family)
MGNMSEKKIELRVERRAIKVHFECPYCEEEVERDYNDFCNEIGEPCDWADTLFNCPECGREVQIYYVDWDC